MDTMNTVTTMGAMDTGNTMGRVLEVTPVTVGAAVVVVGAAAGAGYYYGKRKESKMADLVTKAEAATKAAEEKAEAKAKEAEAKVKVVEEAAKAQEKSIKEVWAASESVVKAAEAKAESATKAAKATAEVAVKEAEAKAKVSIQNAEVKVKVLGEQLSQTKALLEVQAKALEGLMNKVTVLENRVNSHEVKPATTKKQEAVAVKDGVKKGVKNNG